MTNERQPRSVTPEQFLAFTQGVDYLLKLLNVAHENDELLRPGEGMHRSQRRYVMEFLGGNNLDDYNFRSKAIYLRPKYDDRHLISTPTDTIIVRFGLERDHPSKGFRPNRNIVIREFGASGIADYLLTDTGYFPLDRDGLKIEDLELLGPSETAYPEPFDLYEFQAKLDHFETIAEDLKGFGKAS